MRATSGGRSELRSVLHSPPWRSRCPSERLVSFLVTVPVMRSPLARKTSLAAMYIFGFETNLIKKKTHIDFFFLVGIADRKYCVRN